MENCQYVTRAEHEEFRRSIDINTQRIDEHNKRQDARIGELEQTVKDIHEMTSQIKELSVNMNRMYEEQQKQGERLEALESKPIKKMNAVGSTIRTALITAIISSTVSAFVTWLVVAL